MSDEAYTLQVDGDISALSAQIQRSMEELASGVSDNQAEQMRCAAIVERERIASANRIALAEIHAVKARELEELRATNRLAAIRERAALRGGVGGQGNTANGGFLTSLLGAENASASLSLKVRIVAAEFLKMATYSRSATLSLNAFKGASSWLTGGLIGVAIFGITQGLSLLGDMFAKSRSEAKKFREEQEKLNKELLKAATFLGLPKSFMAVFRNLPDGDRMAEEAARKGYVGASGLQRLGNEFGDTNKQLTAKNLVLQGFSEDAAKAFAVLWDTTKGGIEKLVAQAKLADRNMLPTQKLTYQRGFGGFNPAASYSVETLTQNIAANSAVKKAQENVAEMARKLSDPKYFSLEPLTKAAKDFKDNQKEEAKKLTDEVSGFEKLLGAFDALTKDYKKKQASFSKWLDDRNSPDKDKYGLERPADTYFDMQKALADYVSAYKGEKAEIVTRLEEVVSGVDQMNVLWAQLQAY